MPDPIIKQTYAEHVLHVEGITWEGREASYEYHYSAIEEGAYLTHDRARRIASDFESLTSWETWEHRTTIRSKRLQSFGKEGI